MALLARPPAARPPPALLAVPLPQQLAVPSAILTATHKSPSPALVNAAARIASLDAAIEGDPNDVVAWDGRLAEAMREGKPAPIFERAVVQFPSAARIWTAYAEWWEAHDTDQALSVYKRCLTQLPSLDLWSSYLTFCKRHQPLEEIIRAYQRAVDILGTDWRAGLLWAEYMSLLKHAYNVKQKKENPEAEVSGKLLSEDPSPIEGARRVMKPLQRKKVEESAALQIHDEEFLRVAELIDVDVNMIRGALQRAIVSAHSALDKLWHNYEQFERSFGNPQMAQRYLADFMPKYLRGKSTFKELQTLCTGVDQLSITVPITPGNAKAQSKLAERWRKVLQYERTNPLRLERNEMQARVALVYHQASLCLSYHAEIWYDFHSWLDLGGQPEKATTLLKQSVERFLPNDLLLRLLIAHRHELAEAPPTAASLQAADDTYRALLDDMPKPCPLALINYLGFVRRQHGAQDFRSCFLEATDSSQHITWEVYAFAALSEFHVFGSVDAAAKVFRLGLERYGDREPSLLAAYVNFLVGANDLRSTRAELSRGVLDRLQAGVRDRMANRTDPMVRDSLSFLWQKWARLERYFGDAGALRKVVAFRDEEYQNLQRDQDIEEEAIAETPVALGLSATISEVEEGFRFMHLVPHTARVGRSLEAGAAAAPASSAPTPQIRDQALVDATATHGKLASAAPAGVSAHVVRPDVSKMLAFRPALDVVGQKQRQAGEHGEERPQLPTTIPKCLQDLLAVLPTRPLKGAKPDVDYLLTVLQTVVVPPIPIEELEHIRYDSLRIAKDDALSKRRLKEDAEGVDDVFFSVRPSIYRDQLHSKRQKVATELQQAKIEISG